MRVAILPNDPGREGGVTGVIYALKTYLPSLGIELVRPEEADIVHCHAMSTYPNLDVHTMHGLMPEPVDYPWQAKVNDYIYNNLFFAKVVTAPAKWVTKQFAYLGRTVKHIPNGITLEEWKPAEPRGYVLFGKIAGNDGVVSEGTRLAAWVARQCPQIPFVFLGWNDGAPPPNVTTVGRQSFEQMRDLIRHASVYLATTLECHSVQVLEAMASAVPVVGLRWGGTAETVPDEAGILVGDVKEIPDTLGKVMADRDYMGQIAREHVAKHYQWRHIMPMYVQAYKEAWKLKNLVSTVKVSIVITCHNLDLYINEAIDSALAQQFDSFEVIVVDDGSKDNSWPIIESYGNRIKAYHRDKGHGAGNARNYGIERTEGKYICCLDGDDRLHSDYLAKLVPLLERNPWAGIAYSHWNAFGATTGTWHAQEWNFPQLVRGNYIGCASLFRKEAWERVGGYKDINPSWEDYEFWLAIGEARYFGERYPEALWDYRVKAQTGRNYEAQKDSARLRAVVNAYHPRLYTPLVSVIIPCYNHEKYLGEAVQSVLEQTFHDYEIVVVDDGSLGDALQALAPFANEPRLRFIRQENKGLAAARNAGIRVARGTYILPLDADDKIAPEFLDRTLTEMKRGDGIIYTDFVAFRDDGSHSEHEAADYDYSKMINESGMMFCCSLFPRKMWVEVGGYAEDMKSGWEDYAFWIAAGAKGWHGRKIKYFGFWYRQHEKSMRTEAWEKRNTIRQQLARKFGLIYTLYPKGQQHELMRKEI